MSARPWAPFVPFLNRRAEAQPAAFPVRLMLLFTPNGSVPAQFWPSGGETDFTFKPGSITEPLAPYKSKLIFPKGMKRPRGGGGGHESAFRTMWTGAGQTGGGGGFGGYAAGPSIDQIIAKALPADQTTFPSLQFGVQHDGPGANPTVLTVMTYAGPGQPLAPESNPYKHVRPPDDRQRRRAHRHHARGAGQGAAPGARACWIWCATICAACRRASTAAIASSSSSTWTGCRRSRSASTTR